MQSLKQLLESIEHVPIGGHDEHRFCPLCFMGQPEHGLDCQLEAWLELADNHSWAVSQHPDVKALVEAARGLEANLPEQVMDSIRADMGNTNANVIDHWKTETAKALAPFPSLGIPGDEDDNV